MNTKHLDAEIRAQIDQFLTSISALVRQAAVESVREALGDGSRTPTRRGPGRPRKAGTASSTPRATRGSKAAKAKPGRRARRSSEDVGKVADQVLAYVRAHPGQRLEEIGRGLKADTAGLKRPIQTLLGAKALRTEGQKRGTRYFVGGRGGGKAKAAPRKASKRSGRKAGKKAASKAKPKATAKPARKAAKRAGKKSASRAQAAVPATAT